MRSGGACFLLTYGRLLGKSGCVTSVCDGHTEAGKRKTVKFLKNIFRVKFSGYSA